MSEFYLNPDKAQTAVDQLQMLASELLAREQGVSNVRMSLRDQISQSAAIGARLQQLEQEISEESRSSKNLENTLREVIQRYRDAENAIMGTSAGATALVTTGVAVEALKQSLQALIAACKGYRVECCCYGGDPVNLNTGNFIQETTDLSINGRRPFVFKRYYNSRAYADGVFGHGWNCNYDVRILRTRHGLNDYTVLLEDGREEVFLFAESDPDTFLSSNGSLSKLKRLEEGFEYITKAMERYQFDTDGYLRRREDANGNGYNLEYSKDRRIKRIEKDSGECFILSYNKGGELSCVSDHTGRQVRYSIENGYLLSVSCPARGTTHYEYQADGLLQSITDGMGYLTVKNTYDILGRVTSQTFADGAKITYIYDDISQSVRQIERNGVSTTHYHDERFRNIRNVFLKGEESFEYGEQNLITRILDINGTESLVDYDPRGNRTAIRTDQGSDTKIEYAACNKPSKVVKDGIIQLENEYDDRGNLLISTDALGRSYTYAYNEKGLVTDIAQPDGSVYQIDYDTKGNISAISAPLNGKTQYLYDDLNRIVKVIDENQHEHTYEYNDASDVIAEINAIGQRRVYQYDLNGNRTQTSDFDGRVIKRSYNCLNLTESITDKSGVQTFFEYDSMWNVIGVTGAYGAVTRYSYDENNRVTEVVDALGGKTSYQYDKKGNRTSVTDPEGNKSVLHYDLAGRVTKTVDALGNATEFVYDAYGNMVSMKDALGNETNSKFDPAGQLIFESDYTGKTREYTYTPMGDVASVTDENGQITKYTYRPGGKWVTGVYYPDGTCEEFTYDVAGNMLSRKDRAGNQVSFERDELNRITRMQRTDGKLRLLAYDASGKVISDTNAAGEKTCYEYSDTGHLKKTIDPLGNVSEYTHDGRGMLISMRQFGGSKDDCRETTYERDVLGRVTKITDATGCSEEYEYNKIGQMIRKRDRDNFVTKYHYDAHGNTIRIQYDDGSEVEYTYDALYRLKEMRDWLGTTVVETSNDGLRQKVVYHDGSKVAYTFDAYGNQTSVEYPDGKTATYLYDAQRRLIEAKGGSADIRYEYNDAGRLAGKVMSNGAHTQYEYNTNGQLSEVVNSDAQGILDHYQFTYDGLMRKASETRWRRDLPGESGIYTYDYDPAGRLSSVEKDGEALRSYQYDPFGNRIQMQNGDTTTGYRYNNLNQLLEVFNENTGEAVESYQYDRRGNMVSRRMESGMHLEYHYGARNQMDSVKNADGTAAFYQYNGMAQRVGMDVSEIGAPERTVRRTRYTRDLRKRYNNLLHMNDGKSEKTFLWDAKGASVMLEGEDDNWFCYQGDGQDSPVRLTDAKGNLAAYFGYSEFGKPLYENQENVQPFGFIGYQYDEVAHTHYAQAREYLPETGRFLARDIIKGNAKNADSLNEYLYCRNNPIGLRDLDGLDPTPNDEPEFVEVIYLLNEDGANSGSFAFGHAALLLVREDGSSYFYSFAGENDRVSAALGYHLPGFMETHIDEKTGQTALLSEEETQAFLRDRHYIESTHYEKGQTTNSHQNAYTHGVRIPITDPEDGQRMFRAAERIRERPPFYNLYGNPGGYNCNMVAQRILLAAAGRGGLSFSSTRWIKGFRVIKNNSPNSIYKKVVEEIDAGKREGWSYGTLDELYQQMVECGLLSEAG